MKFNKIFFACLPLISVCFTMAPPYNLPEPVLDPVMFVMGSVRGIGLSNESYLEKYQLSKENGVDCLTLIIAIRGEGGYWDTSTGLYHILVDYFPSEIKISKNQNEELFNLVLSQLNSSSFRVIQQIGTSRIKYAYKIFKISNLKNRNLEIKNQYYCSFGFTERIVDIEL